MHEFNDRNKKVENMKRVPSDIVWLTSKLKFCWTGEKEKDLAAATTISKKEAADFTAIETKLVGIKDILRGAVSVLEREMEKNPPAFVQVDTKNRAGLMQSLGALVNTTFARLRTTFVRFQTNVVRRTWS